MSRIEYAAYDVLFNKAKWRHPSSDRRPGVRFGAGTDQDRQTVVVRGIGVDSTILIPWVDPFGVFPIDVTARVHVPAPAVARMPGYTFENSNRRSSQIAFRTTADE